MNNETKHITDLSFKLIEAVADISNFPSDNKIATVAIYRSGHFLYTITINLNDKHYFNNTEFLAQRKSLNGDFVFQLKDEPDTISSLRYLQHDKEDDTHTFLIRPEYKKIDTGELLRKQTLQNILMKKINKIKKNIMKRSKLLKTDKTSECN